MFLTVTVRENVGPSAENAHKGFSQKNAACCQRGSDLERVRSARRFSQSILKTVLVIFHNQKSISEKLSLLCEGELFSFQAKGAYMVIVFNILDVLGNSGLCNVQPFCRPCEIHFLADSQKSVNAVVQHRSSSFSHTLTVLIRLPVKMIISIIIYY